MTYARRRPRVAAPVPQPLGTATLLPLNARAALLAATKIKRREDRSREIDRITDSLKFQHPHLFKE